MTITNSDAETKHEYLKSTVSLIQGIEEVFILLGSRLKKIRDEQMYLPEYESFYDYLVECRLTESKASKLITVYEVFILEYNFDNEEVIAAGGWSLLYESVKFIKSREDAAVMLHELSHRHDRDGRAFLLEKQRGVGQAECAHADTYAITVCRDCGVKIKTNENN